MHRMNCVLMSVLLMIADGLIVKGPSGRVVAPLGSSVVLPCYVDELLSVEGLEVEWKRTDSETLVHLYQDGESRAEAQQQDYQHRAHFITEEIQHGNFSLRLDDLRAEDEGQYTCTVFSQQESGETMVEIKVDKVERLRVSGSSRSMSASVGEDVTLSCSVDSLITPEDLEVSWIKTDEDRDIQVLLFQNNKALPEASDERYTDRVEFFTDETPKGNFSLRLKSVRTEDKGVYMCEVFAGGLSANTTVKLERLGFSVSHIMVLILCVTASGSALQLCCLIYCRTPHEGFYGQHTYNHYFELGSSVVLPCHVDECLLKKKLKVEWRRKDTKTLVHLYQDGESRPQQDYQGRAHFCTDEIQHGNFSLRLDDLSAEDAGEYICKVHSDLFTVTRTAETSLVPWFKVKGSSGNQTVPLGGSVILPCQVDKSLLQKSLKVEWRRTDSKTLVHLYQDGESRPKKQHKNDHHRAHFITDKIKDGNFSIRLEKMRAEDAGKYTCKVYSDQDCVHSADAEVILRFDVKCSRHTLAPLGSSVVLPCYGDIPSSMESLEVEWKRADSETLVHLYQDGESRPEAQQQDYQDRAHFITEEIQHGNFSLRLDDLRAEDEGEYTCTVYNKPRSVFSAKTNLKMGLLDLVFRLQMSLVFCPNILMFLAFVLWGVSEGSLFETVSCCALYFLRPLMLLWTAPYIEFTGKIKSWIKYYSYEAEYVFFSAVFYSVLFKSAWDKSLNYAGFEGVMIIVLFITVLLFNFIYIIFLLVRFIGKLSHRISAIFSVLAHIIYNVLPSLQFILLFFSFGSAKGGFMIIAVLPVFLTVTRYNWDVTCGEEMGCSPAVRRSVYLTLMILINAVLVYFYITALENEKDRVGWACMLVFPQFLWAVINFERSFQSFDLPRVLAVYVFGSVGVVLLSSVALMTELILKTVNGEGLMGDMRIVVFSSEFIFTLFLMILLVFEPWITPRLQSCQNASAAAGSDEAPAGGSNQSQNPAESHEMNPLLNTQNQENGRSGATEETQPDSVVTQK